MNINWSLYPNFSEAEFRCRHTGKIDMDPLFLAALQSIRTDFGRPMRVTSGYRHPSHPVEARKGHSNGEHTRGTCCDIACTSGADRFILVSLALRHGVTRIGIAPTFLHLGIGAPGLPQNVIWEYA